MTFITHAATRKHDEKCACAWQGDVKPGCQAQAGKVVRARKKKVAMVDSGRGSNSNHYVNRPTVRSATNGMLGYCLVHGTRHRHAGATCVTRKTAPHGMIASTGAIILDDMQKVAPGSKRENILTV